MINGNTMQGQGTCAGGKQSFTLRAAVHGSTGSVEGGQDTQYVEVSDNTFIGASGSDFTTSHAPQGMADERVIDVVAERNHYIAGGGATGTQAALFLAAREQTIRNNLFDTSGPAGGKAHTAIRINGNLLPVSNLRVFNNSLYSSDVDNDFLGVDVVPGTFGVTGVTLDNNLAYAPLDSQRWMFNDAGAVVTAAGNTCDTNRCRVRTNTDPNFAVAPPSAAADWALGTGSYALSGGVAVPVWSDFFGKARSPGAAYLGAVAP